MLNMNITGIYASLLAILMIALALRVIQLRRSLGIGLLDGDNQNLKKAIRVHSNAVENLPIALLLMAIAETQGMPNLTLHILGVTLLIARCWHAWGLSHSSGRSKGRFYGTILTFGVVFLLAFYNLYMGLHLSVL